MHTLRHMFWLIHAHSTSSKHYRVLFYDVFHCWSDGGERRCDGRLYLAGWCGVQTAWYRRQRRSQRKTGEEWRCIGAADWLVAHRGRCPPWTLPTVDVAHHGRASMVSFFHPVFELQSHVTEHDQRAMHRSQSTTWGDMNTQCVGVSIEETGVFKIAIGVCKSALA